MKKTITTITLALAMTFGATFANAGILVADRASTPCTETQTATTSTAKEGKGIIVFGRNAGIIVFGAATYMATGIIVFGAKDEACTESTPTDPSFASPGIIVFG